MLRLLLLFAALATTAVTLAIRGAGSSPVAEPQRHDVELVGFRVVPETISVRPGDTVVWTNRDMVPHTATSVGGTWGSGTIEPGASWRFVVGAGDSSDYICALHPSMTGTVVVQ